VTLLMAHHNGIILTQMEMGMTTGLNRKHCVYMHVYVCVRVVYSTSMTAAVWCCTAMCRSWPVHKQIACARRTKTNFLCFGTVLECGAGEVSRRSVGPIV